MLESKKQQNTKKIMLKYITFIIIVCVCGVVYVVGFYEDESNSNDIQLIESDKNTSDNSASDKNVLDSNAPDKSAPDTEDSSKKEQNDKKIWVYITGEVKHSGVYQVSEDARIAGVVELAGGLTKKADETLINLAQSVTDGEHIHVYAIGENIDSSKEQPVVEQEYSSSLVNINTASKDELMSLPGIGESKALKIIEYRQKERFNCIEDIMNISGIKEAAFNKIKEFICV